MAVRLRAIDLLNGNTTIMKRTIVLLFAIIALLQTHAQNPVLMTINGKDVTRAEFEYAYNKNNTAEGAVEQKTIDEYVEMFVNYKLKVAEAESQHLDTLSSFVQEYRTYRDMQLTPHLVDQQFIDSVAKSLYDRQVAMLAGRELLDCSHILVQVKQTASEAERQIAAAKADSIYQRLIAGEDFEALARKLSEDYGSAQKGGHLPTLYPGMTIKEFEDVAYSTPEGQVSKPFLSPVGYHVVKMHSRKLLESFETLYPVIVESLKRQNIEEASAKAKIEKLTAETGKTREEILLGVLDEQKIMTPDLEYLVQEYYDGLLLYEVAKSRVWDVAAEDVQALQKAFKKNKKKYAWTAPRYSGYIISAKTPENAKKAQSLLKKGIPAGKDLRTFLKETINKDSINVVVSGPYFVQKGENSTIDNLGFGDQSQVVKPLRKGYIYTTITGGLIKQPRNFADVKTEVTEDLQKMLEEEWIKELRKKFSYSINRDVLKTVNNH